MSLFGIWMFDWMAAQSEQAGSCGPRPAVLAEVERQGVWQTVDGEACAGNWGVVKTVGRDDDVAKT